MKTIEQYLAEIEQQATAKIQAEKAIKQLWREMAAAHAPVKVGWIIENNQTRIRITELTYRDHLFNSLTENRGYWEAYGRVLKKDNTPSRKSVSGRITILDLDHPRNSVKIISRGA